MTTNRRLLARLLPALGAIALLVIVLRALSHPDGARAATKPDAPATPGAAGAPGGARPVPVLTATVEKRDVPVWLEGLGTVAAWRQVTVRAQVDGRLDQVFFKEGQAVKRGDLLAQIDPRPFEVQLHQAQGALARDQAQLDGAKANLERYRELRKQNLVGQQQVDDQAALVGQAEGAVRIDNAAVESAKLNLDYARIQAPTDGVVGVRLIDPGNVVHAADPTGIVMITLLDPAAVLVTLPEDDLPRITAAQRRGDVPVDAWSRDGAARLGGGKLVVLDNQINSATATLRLKAMVPNPDHALWPNQFVKARLLVDTRRGALVVPASAVQRGPQGTFVWGVGADKKAVSRPVEIALTTADIAIVKQGVAAGETVVVEGQAQLRAGAEVAPRGSNESKPGRTSDGGGSGGAGARDGRGGAR
jgi:multidrug efflux system membrane fusion protein